MSQLTKKIIITGKIEALTGILVGGTNSALSIGGPDKQVVRNPINNMPYIPGSSLKGKMRSLIELRDGTIGEYRGTYGPTNKSSAVAAQLFGYTQGADPQKQQQASRLIVRDSELLNPDDLKGADLLYTEAKSENSIDRITSKANPRTFERVPKGAEFKLNMVLNIFDIDKNETDLIRTVWDALQLVQDDYLGGGGSRGNGQVKFKVTQVIERSGDYYSGKTAEKDITASCGIPVLLT
jgi:CRISPR-associated protein Csm3